MRHGRLPWFLPDELAGEARTLYEQITSGPRARGPQAFPLVDERGHLNGPFNALLAAPEVGTTLQALGTRIRYAGKLDDRAREIAILELAVLRRSEFEWYAHARVGRHAGLDASEITALRNAIDAPSFNDQERLVRAIVRDLVHLRDIPEARYREAETSLGASLLVELVTLVGYYDLLALSLRVFRTPLPDGTEPVFGPEPGTL